MEDEKLNLTPEIVATIPPLPHQYDPEDSRVVSILETVSSFCGAEFTEVPQNPDEEPGVPVPLINDEEEKPKPGDPDFVIDPDDPDKTGQIDPNTPGNPYPDWPSDELDKLREAYQTALAKNLEEKSDYWAKLWQVIRLISTMGCWTESHDDTFIIQYRTQRYEAEQVNGCACNRCMCDDDTIVIPIEYAPLELHPGEDLNPIEKQLASRPFIKAVISVIVNGKRIEQVVDQKYLNERYDPYTKKLYINREDFPELLYAGGGKRCCCLCKLKCIITLWYNAGYYTIPNAILPLVCQLMGKIEDSKKPLSDCTAAVTQVSGLLKSMKTGNIQYAWSDRDNVLGNTQALFTEIYNIASMAELYGLSRCMAVIHEEAGDVI